MEPLKELEQNIKEIISWLKEEFAKVRSNRPNPKLVEHMRVEYLGETFDVNQLGAVGIVPPRDIIVSPWDVKSASAIAKAIETANIGVSVSVDGKTVRISLPQLSEERARELIRLVKSLAEESRIKMRSMRDKAIKKLNELPEDQKFKSKNELQKLVDKFNEEVDSAVRIKTEELTV